VVWGPPGTGKTQVNTINFDDINEKYYIYIYNIFVSFLFLKFSALAVLRIMKLARMAGYNLRVAIVAFTNSAIGQ
jgi:hypothetical protein